MGRLISPNGARPVPLQSRERDEFSDFYADMDNAGTLFLVPGEKPMPPVTMRVVARGPVKSKGPQAINRQLDTFKAAIEHSRQRRRGVRPCARARLARSLHLQ